MKPRACAPMRPGAWSRPADEARRRLLGSPERAAVHRELALLRCCHRLAVDEGACTEVRAAGGAGDDDVAEPERQSPRPRREAMAMSGRTRPSSKSRGSSTAAADIARTNTAKVSRHWFWRRVLLEKW